MTDEINDGIKKIDAWFKENWASYFLEHKDVLEARQSIISDCSGALGYIDTFVSECFDDWYAENSNFCCHKCGESFVDHIACPKCDPIEGALDNCAEIKRLRSTIHEVLGNGTDESIWPPGTLDTVALINYFRRLIDERNAFKAAGLDLLTLIDDFCIHNDEQITNGPEDKAKLAAARSVLKKKRKAKR